MKKSSSYAIIRDTSDNAREGFVMATRVAQCVHYMEEEMTTEANLYAPSSMMTAQQRSQAKGIRSLMKEYGVLTESALFLVEAKNASLRPVSDPDMILGFALLGGISTRVCYLKFFYVRPVVGGRGADLLLRAAELEAVTHGCTVLESDVELSPRVLALFASHCYAVPTQVQVKWHTGTAQAALFLDYVMAGECGAVSFGNDVRDDAMCKAASVALLRPALDVPKFKKDFGRLIVSTGGDKQIDCIWLAKQLLAV